MSEKREIPALTGLRGIAALFVVTSHYLDWAAPWNPQTAPPKVFWIFWSSAYGMTLFFTLSGFVIAYNYFSLDWRDRPLRSFGYFMWKRITRLYPALLVFLLLAGALTNGPALRVGENAAAWTLLHLLSVETWIPAFAGGTVPIGSVFHVSWSISTEIGMYLIFAAAMVLGARLRPLTLLLLAALYVGAIVYLATRFGEEGIAPNRLALLDPATPQLWSKWFFYQSPYFRVLQFAAGACAAWALLRYGSLKFGRHAAAASLLALAALYIMRECPVFPIRVQWLGPWFDPLSAVLFAVVMLNAVDTGSRINRALSWRPLIVVGTISYSLYLFHPFVTRMSVPMPSNGEPFSAWLLPAFALNLSFAMFAAIAFAYGMYFLWEHWTLQKLRGLSPAP